MKKVLLFAFTTIAISTLAQAQIDKGAVFLGGSVYVSSDKSESTSPPHLDKSKSTSYSFFPAVGVAIKPNTIVGLQLGYGTGESSHGSNYGSQEYQNYTAEVFLRKYLPLGKGFNLFAQPGVYYRRNNNESEYPNNNNVYKNTSNSWNVGVTIYPGVSYAVNKKFHLEAGLGNMANISYGQSSTEAKSSSSNEVSKSKGSSFSFSSSLSNGSAISIGFRFFLQKRHKDQ